MGGQPVEFFGDIALLRQQDHFLFQALRVEFGLHVGKAIEDFLPLGRQHLRDHHAQGGDFHRHAVQALVDQASQFSPFAIAAVLQFRECFAEQHQRLVIQGLRVGGIGNQDAWPGQYFQGIQRGGLLDQAGHGFRGGDQLGGALAIDLQGLAGAFLGVTQRALDLAPGQALAQRFAHGAFEVAQGFGQAQVRFEIAMVDRAQFPTEGALGTGPLDAGKGGHAVHHGNYLAEV
ncbi:hypothetical protein D3C76_822050 [compost metagenome]